MNTRAFIFSILLFVAFSSPVFSQAKPTPELAARDFYTWYLTELNAERYPIRQAKRQMLGKVSTRLGRWIYSKSYEEYGADYFLDAQDWDENWVKNISASKAVVKGNTATVNVKFGVPKGTYSGFGPRTLPVGLVKEGGTWRIDKVNNRELLR
jgi:hypothetical protein